MIDHLFQAKLFNQTGLLPPVFRPSGLPHQMIPHGSFADIEPTRDRPVRFPFSLQNLKCHNFILSEFRQRRLLTDLNP